MFELKFLEMKVRIKTIKSITLICIFLQTAVFAQQRTGNIVEYFGKEKIETIAKEIYGADGVDYSKRALLDLKKIENLNLSHLPICMAKTQKSFSDNDKLLCRPEGFRVTVREFEFAAGAGFLIPILGNMMRMPGLPAVPASERMIIDNDGKISGLS